MKPVLLATVVGILLLPSLCFAQEKNDIAFAQSMSQLIRVISKEHFTPASEADLTRWAIQGLFDAAKKPIPTSIAEQLKTLDTAKAETIEVLFGNARGAVGQRKEFADGRDVDICLAAISDKLEPVAAADQRIAVEKASPFLLRGGWRRSHVGLSFEFDRETRYLRVMSAAVNGPAYKAGIRPGYIVTEIRLYSTPDGDPLTLPDETGKPGPISKTYSTKGISTREAELLLRGRPGTRVTLTVIPAQRDKR